MKKGPSKTEGLLIGIGASSISQRGLLQRQHFRRADAGPRQAAEQAERSQDVIPIDAANLPHLRGSSLSSQGPFSTVSRCSLDCWVKRSKFDSRAAQVKSLLGIGELSSGFPFAFLEMAYPRLAKKRTRLYGDRAYMESGMP